MLAHRPGGREAALFGLAYLLYSAGRFVAVGALDVATANAEWILDVEQSLALTSSRTCRAR